KTPLQGIDDLPAFGQGRDDVQVLIALGQPLHDVAERAQGEGLVEGIGIEGVEIALEGVTEGFGGGRCGGKRTRRCAHHRKGSKRHWGSLTPWTWEARGRARRAGPHRARYWPNLRRWSSHADPSQPRKRWPRGVKARAALHRRRDCQTGRG